MVTLGKKNRQFQMRKLSIMVFLLPLFVYGQSTYSPPKSELIKDYSQAIAEYIKAVHQKDKISIDTLFFGKHDQFPDIKLPAEIQNTKIAVLLPAEADRKRKYRESLIYINMVATISKEKAEYIFVTFYPGYTHQYDCVINFKYNSTLKQFEKKSLEFKDYAYKKN